MWALVPVKALSGAKQRLANVLRAAARARLAQAMLDDLLCLLENATQIERVLILTADAAVAQQARRRGHRVFEEDADQSLNENLGRAAQDCATQTPRLLVLPADLPAATREDIDTLLAAHRGGLTLVPASVDGGTNAMLLEPADAVSCQFGERSFARHSAAARRAGLGLTVVENANLGRDLDRPDDLTWLAQRALGPHTAALLASWNVREGLAEAALPHTA